MVNRIVNMIRLVMQKPADPTSPQGRSQERYRRAALGGLMAMVGKVVNIATSLATVPIALPYLGTDRFGIWMTLTGLVAFLSFTDLGLGTGLQNSLTSCHGRDDKRRPRFLVSSALAAMMVVCLVLTVLALVAVPLLPVHQLLKSTTDAGRRVLLPTIQVVLLVFALRLPATLVQRIYMAYQETFQANLWLTAGRVVGFVGVLVCVWTGLDLPWMMASIMGLPFVVLLLSCIPLFIRRPWLIPSIRTVRKWAVRGVAGIGMLALLAQLSAQIIMSGAPLIIANRISTDASTPFGVTQRLLSVGLMLLSMALIPLWPAYGEAAERGDVSWVKRTFRRSLKLALAIQLPMFLIMALAGQAIIRLWAGPDAVPSWWALMGLNVWVLILTINRCISVPLNGLNHMIGQASFGLVFSIIGLAVAYWLAPTYGVTAIVWSIAVVGLLPKCIGLAVELKYVLAKLARKHADARRSSTPADILA